VNSIRNNELRESIERESASYHHSYNIKISPLITNIAELKKMLIEDGREVIRQAAAWAIGEIGGEVAKETLYLSKKGENNPKVLQEIDKSLNKLLNQ